MACANCHSGAGADENLRLDSEDNSYADLVGAGGTGVMSQQSALLRVNPGDPDQSYLVRKLENGPGISGNRMPPGSPLSTQQIAMIRDWITNGAPRTGTGTAPTSFSKVSVESSSGVEFTLRFSRDIQRETLTDDAVQVYFHTADGRRLAALDEYSLAVSSREVDVGVPALPSDTTAVELVVNEPGLSAVLDANGRLIDGDRDQLDGGAFRYIQPL